jgi:hypothetical protein
MANLEAITAELNRVNLRGDVWIDGSFLTRKIDPNDIDLVLHAREGQGLTPTDPDHRKTIIWLNSNLKATHGCDSYVCVIPPIINPAHPNAMAIVSYWKRQFGFSRGGTEKGIAVVAV